jgi:hypothetical protein
LKRKTVRALNITNENALRALHLLVAEGKIAAKDVMTALKRREALIADLRQRLVALEAGALAVAKTARTKVRGRRRKRRISAATRAKYEAQGRYMAALRRLPKAARVKAKAVREKSGVRAAIAAAKRMAK